MDRDGLRAGHGLALLGAVMLLGALWLPWYELRLGPLDQQRLTEGAGALGGGFAELATGLVSQLEGLRLSAWDAFEQADVALAIGAGGVLLILAGASGVVASMDVAPAFAARAATLAGLALGGVVAVKLLDRPGPSELLALAPGAYVALVGCAVMVLGGVLAASGRSSADGRRPLRTAGALDDPGAPAEPLPVLGTAATSVAPPPPRS